MSLTIPPEGEVFWREVAARGLAIHQSKAVVGEDGEEILDALAKLFAFMDERDSRRMDGGYFFEGDGVQTTTGALSVDFGVVLSVDARILAGSPLFVTSWGAVYVALEDVVIPLAGGAQTILIAAAWAGYDGNTPPQLVGGFFIDETLAEPELAIKWSDDTVEADKTLIVTAMSDGTATIIAVAPGPTIQAFNDGSDGPLDLLAESRGILRLETESNLSLALRARALSRKVTPVNILEIVNEILVLVGTSAVLVEWYNAATGGAVSWTFDDDTLGAFDVSPFGQRNCFLVLIREFPYELEGGWAFGDPDGGAFGVAPFGAVFPTHEAILDAVEEAVEGARAFGYGGEVLFVDADWVPTPGLTV